MAIVFMAGSLSITRLHPLFVERIQAVVEGHFSIVVGDADGADASIQQALYNLRANTVTVFCSGDTPRNNIGNWPVTTVRATGEPGSRAYFTAKDIEMAKVADYGLMLWDAKSTGTLSNVIELLKHDHPSRVFVNKEQRFVSVSNATDLQHLVTVMSATARARAEDKISLSRKIATIKNRQLRMTL